MAVTIDWPTQVINVPKADLLLVQAGPPEIRQLDINAFRLELKAIEASEEGISFVDTHSHNPPVTVGGVTLARVVEIINGYTVTFEDGQYAVNLVGANSNIGDVTNVNQVSVRSANSAGLTFSKEIEDQSFVDARVFVNTTDGQSGTQYPRGTTTNPVDNFADAIIINAQRNLPSRFLLKGQLTLSSEDLSDHDWLGTTLPSDSIDLGGSTTTDSHFGLLALSGMANGVFTGRDCVLNNLSGFNGFLFGGAIAGTLTCAAGEVHIVNAHAAASGGEFITIDYNGESVKGFIPGWEGNMVLTNHSHASALTAIDVRSGMITIDATCTAGTICVRGVCSLTDNSGPGCTVNRDAIVDGGNLVFLRDVAEADEEYTASTATKKIKGTSTVLVLKNVSGGDVTNPPINLTE